MTFEISGATAFVTGGGSGIGAGIAEALLEQGARVVIADRDEEALVATQRRFDDRGEVHRMVLDVTDRAAMAATAADMDARFGGVDILCNNAGIGTLAPMFGEGYDDWDRIMAVNIGGIVNGVVSFVPGMVARKRGHVVNTASFGAVIPAGGLFGPYTTTKFAVLGLSCALRDTLAASGIGVSALCPGLVATNIANNARKATPPVTTERDAIMQEAQRVLATGISPLECGRMTVAAIHDNAPYIFTHGELRDQVAAHFDEILACFPAAGPTAADHGETLPFFHGR